MGGKGTKDKVGEKEGMSVFNW